MISFLVAMDKNRVMGIENRLPWRLPADVKFFKEVTMGHPVVMGRKTYDSIGKPLPGRENIILTRNVDYQPEGCKVLHTVEELIQYIKNKNDEVFVIGGAQLFKELFSVADRLYITEIHHEFEGDTFFRNLKNQNGHFHLVKKGSRTRKTLMTISFMYMIANVNKNKPTRFTGWFIF